MNRAWTRSLVPVAAAAIALLTLGVAPAYSTNIFEDVGTFGPQVLGLDPSPRAQGMGDASSAVFWGGGANHWANPALLGYAQGLRYEWDDSRLLPGTFDFRLTTRHATLGYGGIGVAMTGRPFDGLGESRLDMGDWTLTSTGPPMTVETISLAERVRSWGAGVSAAGVARSLAQLRGHDAPGFTRWLDIAVGANRKHVDTPPDLLPLQGTFWDWGGLARIVRPLHARNRLLPDRIEAAYSFSVLNANDVDLITPTRHYRNGVAARAVYDGSQNGMRSMPRWLAPGMAPAVALGLAFDADQEVLGSWRPHSNDFGAELAVANVLFLRGGHVSRSGDGNTDDTWGIGAQLPLGRWAGVRYDYAHVSRIVMSDQFSASSWSVWIDPVAVYHDAR